MISYDQPRGSVHDLAKLAGLSADRCNVLLASDRTLYILHNYAALDCSFSARYAIELEDFGYTPVTKEAATEWQLYQDLVTAFKLEVLSMTCDIETGLVAIADAIRAGGGGGCASPGNPVASCLEGLSDSDILGPGDSSQGNPISDPPPEGFATWEEYFTYKCQAAYFIWSLERKHMVNLRNFEGLALAADIVVPVVAGLAGVLPAMMTPAGFAIFIASILAIGIVSAASWFYMDEMIDWWDDNQPDIVCALYNSGTSPGAVSALANALEDAIQAIVAWGALAPVSGAIADFLGAAFSQLAGNGIVEPLFQAVVAVSSVTGEFDCSTCVEECTGRETHYWGWWEDDPETDWEVVSNSGVTIDQVQPFMDLSGGSNSKITIQTYDEAGYCVDQALSFRIKGYDDVGNTILLKCWIMFADALGVWSERYAADVVQLNPGYPSNRNLFFMTTEDTGRRVVGVRMELGHEDHSWAIHLDRMWQQA